MDLFRNTVRKYITYNFVSLGYDFGKDRKNSGYIENLTRF